MKFWWLFFNIKWNESKIMCVSTLRACPQFLNQIVGQNSEKGFACPIF
jgi:hypothetical protein